MLWPDTFVTKFFFKSGFDKRTGSLLELGGGNGNNARLFTEYGWHVTGLDFDPNQVADARANWSEEDPSTYDFREWDLRKGLPQLDRHFDALVGNGSLYYFERSYLEQLLSELRSLLKPGAYVYFRFRTPNDWRYGKGDEIERNTFRLTISESNEFGNTMAFFEPDEIVEIVESQLGVLNNRVVLHDFHENIQKGLHTANDDVVIWGQL